MSRVVVKRPAADRRRTILYATLAVIAIAIIVAVAYASRVPRAATEAPPMQSHLKAGQSAPEFAIQTTAGPFDLANVTTPVLLEVFAAWCPHCQRETRVLNGLATRYAGRLAIVGVTGSPYGMDATSPETQADVDDFAQRFALRYPVAFDPDLKIAQLYLQGGYPTLVLIDTHKTIRMIKEGEIPAPVLAKTIDGVLR